jgi:kynurenine formamidase
MKIIDLTQTIKMDMPVYPGTKELNMYKSNTIEKDGFKEKIIEFCSHTGTHMDAPSHMKIGGTNLDEFEVSKFIGKALLLDINEQLKITDYEENIKKVDFIIFKTNYDKYWGEERYFTDYPVLDIEVVKYLMKFKLKGLGFDAISIDPVDSDFENHIILFNNDMIIIENLCNLNRIKKQIFDLFVLPLKIEESDGAPIRAVAIV